MRKLNMMGAVFAALAFNTSDSHAVVPKAPRRTIDLGGPATQAEYLAALRKHPNHPYNLLKRYEEYVYANARQLSNVELDRVVNEFLKPLSERSVDEIVILREGTRKEKIEWVLEKHTETFKRRWSEENKFEFTDIEDPDKFTAYLKSLREKAKPTVQE